MTEFEQKFYGTVGGVTAKGDVYITQNNQEPERDFDLLLSDFKQFLDDLQVKHSNLDNETAIQEVIDAEAKLVELTDPKRGQGFHNLKRLWNGSRKAVVKVGEHFAEQSPWVKGAVAFLEGMSEDV